MEKGKLGIRLSVYAVLAFILANMQSMIDKDIAGKDRTMAEVGHVRFRIRGNQTESLGSIHLHVDTDCRKIQRIFRLSDF